MPEIRLAHTWKDPRWQATIGRLPPVQRFAIENSLRLLIEALKTCRHPRLDGAFQGWNPTKWDAPRQQATRGDWIEYRLGDDENRARAIICWDSKEGVIYLVARTVIHDHTALREMVANFRK